jgi:hypothetical protein
MTAIRMAAISALLALLAACGPSVKDDHPFGTRASVPHGLRGQLYPLPKGTDRLPDFGKLSPKGVFFASQLNLTPRNDVNGFQGVTDRNEWFGFVYQSTMTAARPGSYGFRLVSDDGARLLIDGRSVVDNDGVHAPASAAGAAELAAGPHKLEVQYFKGPHYQAALQLYCTAPGGQEALFPHCGLDLETPSRLSDQLWWLWLAGLFVIAAGWWLLRGRKG